MPKKLTKEEFLKRALLAHGDFYDYSRVLFENAQTKVKIICPEHGEFHQIPKSHMKGSGCRQCGIQKTADSKKIGTHGFKKRAHHIHSGKYDYSKVCLDKLSDEVTIICPEHGEFQQAASDHLAGCGCQKCAASSRQNSLSMGTHEFIEKSSTIHAGRYSYDRVDYINNATYVEIHCPDHGYFFQAPATHLSGRGCWLCGCEKRADHQRMTIEEFQTAGAEIHDGFYTYDKATYTNYHTPVVITCPIHGDFTQSPSNHLQGKCCTQCGFDRISKSKTKDQQYFEARSREMHGERFDYSLSNYVSAKTPLTVICPEHGEFSISPDQHYRGGGCRKCQISKMELAAMNWLDSHNIEYIPEWINESCRDKHPLKFDFALVEEKILIECDGQQHFMPVRRSKRMTMAEAQIILKEIQRRDKIKTDWAKSNGYNLIRIRFDESVEDVLSNSLPFDVINS